MTNLQNLQIDQKPLPKESRHGPGSPVDQLLSQWAEWYRTSGSTSRGFGSRSAGLASGGLSSSFEDMYDKMISQCCRIADRVIDDLEPIEKCAIHNRYLAAVFRFRQDPAEVLDRALESFYQQARREVAWL